MQGAAVGFHRRAYDVDQFQQVADTPLMLGAAAGDGDAGQIRGEFGGQVHGHGATAELRSMFPILESGSIRRARMLAACNSASSGLVVVALEGGGHADLVRSRASRRGGRSARALRLQRLRGAGVSASSAETSTNNRRMVSRLRSWGSDGWLMTLHARRMTW